MNVKSLFVGLLAGWVGAVWAVETNDTPLRVWSISGDTFDYVFMSAVRQANGDALLSFNHRDGRTAFRKLGQKLDTWLIARYTPATRAERNPSTGLIRQVEAGQVVLRDEKGETRILVQGQPLPDEGRRATLVNLATGGWFSVRAGDALALSDEPLPVVAVGTNSVAIARAEKTTGIEMISAAETAALKERLVAQAEADRAAEARRQAAAERAAAESWAQDATYVPPAPEPPIAGFSRSDRGLVNSVVGPVPVEYTVIPPLFDNTGRMVRGPIVVPTRFETHAIGGYGLGGADRIIVPTVRVAPP